MTIPALIVLLFGAFFSGYRIQYLRCRYEQSLLDAALYWLIAGEGIQTWLVVGVLAAYLWVCGTGGVVEQ